MDQQQTAETKRCSDRDSKRASDRANKRANKQECISEYNSPSKIANKREFNSESCHAGKDESDQLDQSASSKFYAEQHRYSDDESTRSYGSEKFEHGRTVRLAMEMHLSNKVNSNVNSKEAESLAQSEAPTPDIKVIIQALYTLNNRQNTDLSKLLELLVQFDELEGWRESGSRDCIAWMNQYLHIDKCMGWERLRVGHQLRQLPVISALFGTGRLSWSKVRILTRIATPENEQLLAHAALDASVSDVARICNNYRWNHSIEDDQHRDLQQFQQRSLTWRRLANGNTLIRLELTPEQAQCVLLGIEQCEQLLYEEEKNASHSAENNPDQNQNQNQNQNQKDGKRTCNDEHPVCTDSDDYTSDESTPVDGISVKQRKADAVVMMSNRSVAYEREDLPAAERFHVVLNVDSAALAEIDDAKTDDAETEDAKTEDSNKTNHDDVSQAHSDLEKTKAFLAAFDPANFGANQCPLEKPVIEGVGPVSQATARRLSCDCRITTLVTEAGEPLSIGRKSRIWAPSLRTAIVARDRHCQFPGCTAHRHLQIHHIKHWADGGPTSVDNGVCLCHFHHQLIHQGQFEILRSDSIEANILCAGANDHVGLDDASAVNSSTIDNMAFDESTVGKSKVDESAFDKSAGLYSSAKKMLLPTRCRFVVRRLNQTELSESTVTKVAEAPASYTVGFRPLQHRHGSSEQRVSLGDGKYSEFFKEASCRNGIDADFTRSDCSYNDAVRGDFTGCELNYDDFTRSVRITIQPAETVLKCEKNYDEFTHSDCACNGPAYRDNL